MVVETVWIQQVARQWYLYICQTRCTGSGRACVASAVQALDTGIEEGQLTRICEWNLSKWCTFGIWLLAWWCSPICHNTNRSCLKDGQYECLHGTCREMRSCIFYRWLQIQNDYSSVMQKDSRYIGKGVVQLSCEHSVAWFARISCLAVTHSPISNQACARQYVDLRRFSTVMYVYTSIWENVAGAWMTPTTITLSKTCAHTYESQSIFTSFLSNFAFFISLAASSMRYLI